MINFWNKLRKPIICLAPMANVTDAAFRVIIAKYGKPDIMFTEFVSCDGLMSPGRASIMIDLQYSEIERPIVAQVFGSNPDNFIKTAKLIERLGFDGIDINMGCPDRSIEAQGAGAALIKNPSLACEIVKITKKSTRLPISVKTRIGYNKDITEEWIGALLDSEPAAIIIHARTRKEMSKVPANWDAVKRAVKVCNHQKSKTLILGNGDVKSLKDAHYLSKTTGADGIMIARGIFGNPWFFANSEVPVGIKQKLEVLIEHIELFEKLFKHKKNFAIMKKHFKAYVSGFKGAKDLRIKLMSAENLKNVRKIIKKAE